MPCRCSAAINREIGLRATNLVPLGLLAVWELYGLVHLGVSQHSLDPNGSVGAEPHALLRIKELDGADQSQRSLLHKVLLGRSLMFLLFDHRVHQAKVGCHQLVLGNAAGQHETT